MEILFNLDLERITLIFGILYVIGSVLGFCLSGLGCLCAKDDNDMRRKSCWYAIQNGNTLLLGTLTILAIVLQKSWLLWPTIINSVIKLVIVFIEEVKICVSCGNTELQNKLPARFMGNIFSILFGMAYIFVVYNCAILLGQKSASVAPMSTTNTTLTG
ncbi:hypothetical protein QR680_000276 [Steinernema hermaphroditum]|uniref:Uncharacterized protein n=1 Tax=Steinernema hermaphroditum TaxID=289476 RepID=A0AA39LDW3_9BILA|nr:hypothetical protein QR680_000276 [Steinernema hermaphroditum]